MAAVTYYAINPTPVDVTVNSQLCPAGRLTTVTIDNATGLANYVAWLAANCALIPKAAGITPDLWEKAGRILLTHWRDPLA